MCMFPIKTHHLLPFVCLLTIFCFQQTTTAQSGRKKKIEPVITAPVTDQVKTEPQKSELEIKISSLKIVAKLDYGSGYFHSNDFKDSLKELERDLSLRYRFSLKVERGEKMDFEEAKELAKTETETYILWIGFVAKNSSSGVMYFDFAQYAILKPQTAEFVTKGIIEPRYAEFANPGGILLPPTNDRRFTYSNGMKESIRQLEIMLQKGGWFE